jgi:hypothetical protein
MDGRFDIELVKRQIAQPTQPIAVNIQLNSRRPRLKDMYKKYIKDESNFNDTFQQSINELSKNDSEGL